jgi:hypothetical protein
MYPHIADLILSHAPFASLLALRHASRAVRDRVDTILVRQLVMYPEAAAHFGTYHGGEYHRLPRSDWHDVPVLLDAVRAIDLVPPLPAKCKHGYDSSRSIECLCGDGSDSESSFDQDDYNEAARTYVCFHPGILDQYNLLREAFCTYCFSGHRPLSPLHATLASKLLHVELVRQWDEHDPRKPIETVTSISFVPFFSFSSTCEGNGYSPERGAPLELIAMRNDILTLVLRFDSVTPHTLVDTRPGAILVRFHTGYLLSLIPEQAIHLPSGFAETVDICVHHSLRLLVVVNDDAPAAFGVEDVLEAVRLVPPELAPPPIFETWLEEKVAAISEDEYREWLGVPTHAIEQHAPPPRLF